MEKLIEQLNFICPLYKNGTSNREIRHDFFKEIQTEIQAYLLGFIAADGSIDEERHTLSIHLSKVDTELCNLFRTYISPEAYVKEESGCTFKSRGKIYTSNDSIKLSIASKILIQDLKNLGITQAKTWKELHIPNIPNELIIHFIRGYFDGDGCFTYFVRQPNPKNREKNPRVSARWEICSKRDEILKDIKSFLNMKYGLTLNLNYITRDDMYKVQTGKKETLKEIYKALYTNSIFYLKRKFDKFYYYVNTEVTQIISDTVTRRDEIIPQEYGTSDKDENVR
jgi:hypothetical protein|nr:MAG TPA: Intein splicing domain [Caudoviricetes sp.]